ncbi:MAG TPA: DUF998 domain-containing protein [Propionibacteriaceae bacterium]|jgi:Protein of unknown function (DUF998)|nr:DUF998 domain-containing protein [Propionibacteriaceae bacterium]
MSSTIDRSPERVRGEIPAASPLVRARIPLLVCGIAASLLYGTMIWVIRYDGYSPMSYTVSELSAWGVSTRPLWMVLGTIYDALMIAFALGVWASAGEKRFLRIAGGLLFAYGLLGVAWPFAAMHQRNVLAVGGETAADTAHLILAGVTVALMFAAMAFGAAAFGLWFRLYSIATIVVLLAFGGLTTSNAARVAADLPTPWVGLWERINICVFLLWVVVLAIVLLRNRDHRHAL